MSDVSVRVCDQCGKSHKEDEAGNWVRLQASCSHPTYRDMQFGQHAVATGTPVVQVMGGFGSYPYKLRTKDFRILDLCSFGCAALWFGWIDKPGLSEAMEKLKGGGQ